MKLKNKRNKINNMRPKINRIWKLTKNKKKINKMF